MVAADVSERIERLFSSQPRNGSDDNALWHKRAKIEGRLSQLLKAGSQNICIDGPTGSGKSSLALTVLNRISQPFIWLPLVNDMHWSDLCEDLVDRAWEINARPKCSQSTNVKVSIDKNKALSGADVLAPWKMLDRINFSIEAQNLHSARQAARDWSITDVEGFLQLNSICLVIDDFEKATSDLVLKVANLCKRLTFRSTQKCLIIGTGDTFAKLYGADEGLDGRLAELSVASFGSKLEVWNYINDGFERLGFETPRVLLRAKRIAKAEADRIEEAIYEAADGMPKYVNELALRICHEILSKDNIAELRSRISSSDIVKECGRMLDENLSRCNQGVRGAEKRLRSSVELRMVLRAVFELGANGVHRVSDLVAHIERSVDDKFSYDQFLAGLEELRKLGLYVQTGKSGEVVFAKDPMFSHVLGLICHDPARYKKDPSIFGLVGQRSLPLVL